MGGNEAGAGANSLFTGLASGDKYPSATTMAISVNYYAFNVCRLWNSMINMV